MSSVRVVTGDTVVNSDRHVRSECNVFKRTVSLFGEVKNFSRPGIETEYIKKEAFKGSK